MKSPGAAAARRALRTTCSAACVITRRSGTMAASPRCRGQGAGHAGIDQNGLDEMDKRILEAVIVKFGGGPVA